MLTKQALTAGISHTWQQKNDQSTERNRDRQMEGLKLPPHSLEAEQSVLGGLMLDNERWDNVAERVVSNDFFSRPHRLIFTEMQRLLEMSKPIDLITLSESLEQKGDLDSVGGFAYLAELSKNTQVRPTSALMLISSANVQSCVK
ncbi:Replicative DNA helicase [Ewingella americana]|uniref:Replicative DNA helicase n=1 Tax=Ewingella americana TaxID=41202 RepID=A0A377N7Z7_9GAMM|nr:Replicative DNA helicase [Ewingella americana]